MKTPGLLHFETFLYVAENKSITLAARQLGVSKAAVSYTIRLLEASLQIPLFIRTTRKIDLTEEGELLYLQCKRLKNELESARNLVSSFDGKPSGTLRISCNPYFFESRLFDILENYMQRFPEVKLEILAEERMPDMERDQIDIVFGVNWPAPLDVVAKSIGNTRYVLCASPEYLKEFGTPENIKDLEHHHYIPHSGRSEENIVVNLKNRITLNLNPQLKLNNAHFMKKCAMRGWGVVQLHDYMIEDELSKGLLVEVLKDCTNPEIPIYIYYQKQRFVQPKIRQFIKYFVKK